MSKNERSNISSSPTTNKNEEEDENVSRKRKYSSINDDSRNNSLNDNNNEITTLQYEGSLNNNLLEHQPNTSPTPTFYIKRILEKIVHKTFDVTLSKNIKTKGICFCVKSQQTFVVTGNIYATNHPKNVFTNGTLIKDSVENVLSHHISTDIEEYSPECYIEHRFIGFQNIWEIRRYENILNFLTRTRNNNINISRNTSRHRHGSFFHPIQVRHSIYRRNIPTGRVSINNGIITRVIWSRGGPRTIVLRKRAENKILIFPPEPNFGRYINLLHEYEYDVEDSDDYLETIRKIISINCTLFNENRDSNLVNLSSIYNNDLLNQDSG